MASMPTSGFRLRHRRIPGPPADPVKARLLRLHVALLRRFGPQHWWPGRSADEVAIGAVLVQHTAWTGAARALDGLRARRWLSARRLHGVSEADLAAVIRPAGTYRVKARRLKAFAAWLVDRWGGRWDRLRRAPLEALRREMLGVAGLGPETVDAILLYAAGRPVFVADAYARRVLVRHGMLPASAGYEAARAFLEAHLPSDPALFNEFHALLVAAGKAHCRTRARCDDCPLRFDLRGDRSRARRAHGPATSISTAASLSAASGIARVRARSPMSLRAEGAARRLRTRSRRLSGLRAP
jgi:endonuclease-3 related protein